MILNTLKQRSARRGSRLAPTLRSLTQALHEAMFAEAISRRAGFLQTLDPRTKVLATGELLLCVGLSHNVWVILAVYVVALALAWRSAIFPTVLIRRVWLAMPFFTVPIALPALFLTPGAPLITLPLGLTLTQSGFATAALLLARVSASLTLTLLLIYSTSWNAVLAALRNLGLPGTFALVLGMTHRYIDLLLRAANDMLTSRESRVVGHMSTSEGQRLIGAAAAALLDRSLKLSGDVYLAMQSRGYRGAMVSLKRSRMTASDWSFLLMITLMAAAFGWLGR